MQINWLMAILIGIILVGIIVWTSVQNHRDRKKLEKQLNEDGDNLHAGMHKED